MVYPNTCILNLKLNVFLCYMLFYLICNKNETSKLHIVAIKREVSRELFAIQQVNYVVFGELI